MLQALTEAGICPDLLIGTSVGAVNAAFMAASPCREGAARLGEIWRGLRAAREHLGGARGRLQGLDRAQVVQVLGERAVVEAEVPEPPDDTWPLFFHEAAESHRATFPERAAEYGDNVRAKLEHAQTIEPDSVERARGWAAAQHGGHR